MQETQETWVWSLGQEDLLEEEMATHCSILAWEIPWTEDPDGLQSMGLQRGRHDWAGTDAQEPGSWACLLTNYAVLLLSYSQKKKKKGGEWEKKIKYMETSLAVQQLRLWIPNAEDPGLFPGQGTRFHLPQLRNGAAE